VKLGFRNIKTIPRFPHCFGVDLEPTAQREHKEIQEGGAMVERDKERPCVDLQRARGVELDGLGSLLAGGNTITATAPVGATATSGKTSGAALFPRRCGKHHRESGVRRDWGIALFNVGKHSLI
jgi:hypothetical protein